jgi:hypothetical protein
MGMTSFMVFWMIMFVSLAVTLAVLNPIYSVFGADLGLRGFKRETVIAAVVSLLQAGIFWAVLQVTGLVLGRALFGSAAVLYVGYKITHLTDSVFEGYYAMDDWAIGAIAFTQYGLLVSASYVLPTILSR